MKNKQQTLIEVGLLALGIMLTLLGVFVESSLSKSSIVLGVVSLVSGYLSSRQNSSRLEALEKTVGASEVVNYVEKVYELYKHANSSDQVYACTSSWIVSSEIRKSLSALKSNEVHFLGPITSDKQMLGALFRYHVSKKERPDTSTQLKIYHKPDNILKFVVVGDSVVLSSSSWMNESTHGFFYEDAIVSETFKKLFKEILLASATPLHNVFYNRYIAHESEGVTVSYLTSVLVNINGGSMGFDEKQITEALQEITSDLEGLKMVRLDQSKKDYKIFPEIEKKELAENNKMPAVRLILNKECNFNCLYCPDSQENYAGTPDTQFKIEDWLWIIRQFTSLGVSAFRLTGGEPTLIGKEALEKIAQEVKDFPDCEFKLATNGYSLGSILEIFSSVTSNFHWKISLDSLSSDKASHIAGKKIDVERIKENIKKACDMGFGVGINTVVTKDNEAELQEIFEFSTSHGAYLKVLDFDWYPDLASDLWRTNYVSTSEVEFSGIEYEVDDTVYTHGGYGLAMKSYNQGSKELAKIKDTTKGATYGAACSGCKYFPCQEGVYQLSITTDFKIKVCRLRPDLGISVFDIVANRDANAFKDLIGVALKEFFFTSRRLRGIEKTLLQQNMANY